MELLAHLNAEQGQGLDALVRGIAALLCLVVAVGGLLSALLTGAFGLGLARYLRRTQRTCLGCGARVARKARHCQQCGRAMD